MSDVDPTGPNSIRILGAKAKLFLDAVKASKELGTGIKEEEAQVNHAGLKEDLEQIRYTAVQYPEEVAGIVSRYMDSGITSYPTKVDDIIDVEVVEVGTDGQRERETDEEDPSEP